MIAGHQVAAGPEVRLAVRKAGYHLPGDRDGNLRVLLAVPQVDRGGHLIEAESSRTAVPEQVGGQDRCPLPVALPQVGDQELLGAGANQIRWVVSRSASGSRRAMPWANRCGSPRAERSTMVPAPAIIDRFQMTSTRSVAAGQPPPVKVPGQRKREDHLDSLLWLRVRAA